MKIASFVSNVPTMGDTRTYEDFYKYLSLKPSNLGVVTKMYPNLTATYLTEALQNIFYTDQKKNKYQSIDTMVFDWECEVNYIKRIPFASQPEGNGAGGSDIIMAFQERYYDKYDTFKVDKTGLQFIVLSDPNRKADNYFEYVVRLVANNYDTLLDASGCFPGDTTRWISNAHPEMHDRGTTKWQSNIEKFRGYLTTHRCDAEYSALYAAHEDLFVNVKESKGNGPVSETIYKLDRTKKNLLENFMLARNQALMFAKSNVDPKTGKPTIVDPITNRPKRLCIRIIKWVG